MKLRHRFALLGLASLAAGLFAAGAVQAQSAAARVQSVAPVAPPPARSTGAPAFGLPSPSGLNSRFPAGLTAATLAAPGGAADASGSNIPSGRVVGRIGGVADGSGGADAGLAGAVATNVLGAAGALQPPELGPGPYTIVDVARSFLLADANRDGELSRAEAQRLTLGNFSFEALDRNHDGVITRWEYEDAMR
jgi:hypothetical protein